MIKSEYITINESTRILNIHRDDVTVLLAQGVIRSWWLLPPGSYRAFVHYDTVPDEDGTESAGIKPVTIKGGYYGALWRDLAWKEGKADLAKAVNGLWLLGNDENGRYHCHYELDQEFIIAHSVAESGLRLLLEEVEAHQLKCMLTPAKRPQPAPSKERNDALSKVLLPVIAEYKKTHVDIQIKEIMLFVRRHLKGLADTRKHKVILEVTGGSGSSVAWIRGNGTENKTNMDALQRRIKKLIDVH